MHFQGRESAGASSGWLVGEIPGRSARRAEYSRTDKRTHSDPSQLTFAETPIPAGTKEKLHHELILETKASWRHWLGPISETNNEPEPETHLCATRLAIGDAA